MVTISFPVTTLKQEKLKMDAATIAHRAVQLNPNNPLYWRSRGYSGRPTTWMEIVSGAPQLDRASVMNLAFQLNMNDVRYWLRYGHNMILENWALITSPVVKQLIYDPLLAIEWGKYMGTFRMYGNDIVNTALWICSWKGLLIVGVVAAGTFTYDYYSQHKEQMHQYAYNWALSPSNLKDTIADSKVWRYGIVVPSTLIWRHGIVASYNVTASGAVYTAGGLYNLARKIGYYCGQRPSPKQN